MWMSYPDFKASIEEAKRALQPAAIEEKVEPVKPYTFTKTLVGEIRNGVYDAFFASYQVGESTPLARARDFRGYKGVLLANRQIYRETRDYVPEIAQGLKDCVWTVDLDDLRDAEDGRRHKRGALTPAEFLAGFENSDLAFVNTICFTTNAFRLPDIDEDDEMRGFTGFDDTFTITLRRRANDPTGVHLFSQALFDNEDNEELYIDMRNPSLVDECERALNNHVRGKPWSVAALEALLTQVLTEKRLLEELRFIGFPQMTTTYDAWTMLEHAGTWAGWWDVHPNGWDVGRPMPGGGDVRSTWGRGFRGAMEDE